jgi:hypothetical protein
MNMDAFPVEKLVGISGPIVPAWNITTTGFEPADPSQDYEFWWAQTGPTTYIPIPASVIEEMKSANKSGRVYEIDFRKESADAAAERIRGELNAAAARVKRRSRELPGMLR